MSISFHFERELQFEIRGAATNGTVQIKGVQWIPEKGKWACEWSISHVHPDFARMYGDDSLDALTKTIDFVSSFIRGSELDGLRVWWKERGDHAGLSFPLCESESWNGMPPLLGEQA